MKFEVENEDYMSDEYVRKQFFTLNLRVDYPPLDGVKI